MRKYVHNSNSVDFRKIRNKAFRLGVTQFDISRKKNHKYVLVYNNRTIHVGDRRYSDLTFHKDEERKKNYQARHREILTKEGKKAYLDKNQPAYWAYFLLWD
jgi:hypothetical protein